MNMFSCKIHNCGEKMAAIADTDIIGKALTDTIEVTKDFYGNASMDAGEVLLLLRGCTIINAIGKESVKLLVKEGLVDPESVLEIGGVPHAQVIYTR